ncbi:hypothetical protein GOBAR_DD13346 [Gossypium barbadense]|nr:hypothetical protein GOBAR_DD13346 [Gossypium barbadense]
MPGGMLVRGDGDDSNLHHNHEAAATSSAGPMIKIDVAYGSAQHQLFVPSHSTVGELKKQIAEETGLEPDKQRVLFRGKEKEDDVHLSSAGMKDKSKILVLENPTGKVKKVEEMANVEEKVEELIARKESKVEEIKETEEMSKAFAAVGRVRKEVDKLSERVAAIEVAVNSGTKIAAEEFDVRRVQGCHETLDKLKTRNSNPFHDSNKAASVTTKWETFDSGMGSSTAPPPQPMSSSTKVTEEWEKFD